MDLCCRPRVFQKVSMLLNFWRYSLSLNSFLGFLMSTSKDKKPVLALKAVPMMSKITEDKLIGSNY